MLKNKNTIFGIRTVIEAINAGKDIEKVMIQKGLSGNLLKELLSEIKSNNVPIQYLPSERFKPWDAKNHQGVMAILSEIPFQDIENILPGIYETGEDPFILILDQVTDIRNFGAIARTAECAGIQAIIIPDKGNAPINADAIKTSAGALLKIPVCRTKDINLTIKLLKANGLKIIAASEKSSTNYTQIDYAMPIAIIMGSEDKGISPTYLKQSDQEIRIPVV
jgi:23S rRNA (guanosine2251-2'-O)-methyltransferase